jgi:hypothetical protein
MPSWQQAFWLEALLLADPGAAAAEAAFLALLHAPPAGQPPWPWTCSWPASRPATPAERPRIPGDGLSTREPVAVTAFR